MRGPNHPSNAETVHAVVRELQPPCSVRFGLFTHHRAIPELQPRGRILARSGLCQPSGCGVRADVLQCVRRLCGRPRASCRWRLAFRVADGKQVNGMGDLLLGMNAHVNRDLPFVLASIGLTMPDGSTRKPDHDQINIVLNRVVEPLINELGARFDPSIAVAPTPLGVGYSGLMQTLVVWRELAWRNAELLVTAPTEAARDVIAANIEASAVATGTALMAASRTCRRCRRRVPGTAIASHTKSREQHGRPWLVAIGHVPGDGARQVDLSSVEQSLAISSRCVADRNNCHHRGPDGIGHVADRATAVVHGVGGPRSVRAVATAPGCVSSRRGAGRRCVVGHPRGTGRR